MVRPGLILSETGALLWVWPGLIRRREAAAWHAAQTQSGLVSSVSHTAWLRLGQQDPALPPGPHSLCEPCLCEPLPL